ncbi:MAG: hypothetical protein P4M00_02360 [Azospirillaceae bacterium]|nr:hypothetical protein [Azospirillaceae bacterium]
MTVPSLDDVLGNPSDYSPATFAERGVTVGFTSPVVAQARIRASRHKGMELVMPNLTGGKGFYLFQWTAVLHSSTVTVHDRRLYGLIAATRVLEPGMVRRQALRAASEGLAGRRAAQRARQVIREDQEYSVLTNFLLLSRLLQTGDAAIVPLLDANNMPVVNSDIREAAQQVATDLGLTPDALYDRIETLGQLVLPLGLPWAPTSGRLRRLIGDLERFAGEAAALSALSFGDFAMLADVASRSARNVAALGRAAIAEIDRTIENDLTWIVGDWPTARKTFPGTLFWVGWLLDGWDYIITAWQAVVGLSDRAASNGVAGGSIERQRDALVDLAWLLPLMPKEVQDATAQSLNDETRDVQRRWAHAQPETLAGRTLLPAIRHNEELKAAVA